MTSWKLAASIIIALILVVESKQINFNRHVRSTDGDICSSSFNSMNEVQCVCQKATDKDLPVVINAECWLTKNNTSVNDAIWNRFNFIRSAERIMFTTSTAKLTYIPTLAIKQMSSLLVITLKYASIDSIPSFAFANLSFVQDIRLNNNEIKNLQPYAFANHRDLKSITLDTNQINEIKRLVFHNLPSLEKLYLSYNNITTIHDRAFVDMRNLLELELDKNAIFVLTNETFTGLHKLTRLELSNNNIEVIGDNTFAVLKNLRSLNLEGNKIRLLDDKAFSGLPKLQTLSLARNKLMHLNNNQNFIGLKSLQSLNFKSNGLISVSENTIAPILSNFYGNFSTLEFDENKYPCTCELDWFMKLRNKTNNENLKLALENLKCIPDSDLSEKLKKYDESEKLRIDSEERLNPAPNGDYEYYDETQLDGKIFYIDIPKHLLPCSKKTHLQKNHPIKQTTTSNYNSPTFRQLGSQMDTTTYHKLPSQISTTYVLPTYKNTYDSLESTTKNVDGTTLINVPITVAKMEVSNEQSNGHFKTEKTLFLGNMQSLPSKKETNTAYNNEKNTEPNSQLYSASTREDASDIASEMVSITTSRSQTVSPNPLPRSTLETAENAEHDKEMASDEAAKQINDVRNSNQLVEKLSDTSLQSRTSKASTTTLRIQALVIPIMLLFSKII